MLFSLYLCIESPELYVEEWKRFVRNTFKRAEWPSGPRCISVIDIFNVIVAKAVSIDLKKEEMN